MDSCDLSRRFVRHLLDWAAAPPDAHEVKRELMDPANEFWPWICRVIERCYRPSLDQFWGVTKAEFRDHCVHKVFEWAETKPALLAQTDFTDAKLGAFIKTTARNERVSIWRRMQKLNSLESYWDGSSGFSDEAELKLHAMPGSMRVEPAEPFAQKYERLRAEFQRARSVMPPFNRSLKGKKRMRKVLALLLRLGRRKSRKRGFPAYWFAYRVLKQRGKHLPPYLRGFLRKRLSPLNPKAINSRLGYLRRAFGKFSL